MAGLLCDGRDDSSERHKASCWSPNFVLSRDVIAPFSPHFRLCHKLCSNSKFSVCIKMKLSVDHKTIFVPRIPFNLSGSNARLISQLNKCNTKQARHKCRITKKYIFSYLCYTKSAEKRIQFSPVPPGFPDKPPPSFAIK
jgi:hypothetical protein